MDPLTAPQAIQSFEKAAANNRTSVDSWQLEMGDVVVTRRSASCTADLLQNCDLPPPIRIFSPIADNVRRKISTLKQNHRVNQCDGESEQNQSLLRALQLSQTRAREAEKKTWEANVVKEQMTALLLEDSLRLHAARQWVRLLEMEISLLKQSAQEEERDETVVSAMTWCLAFTLCLGIAGAGFVLGCYIF